MQIYLNNNSVKFHPNLIWNDRALGFLKRSRNKKNKKKQQQQQDDMGSVPDPKTVTHLPVLFQTQIVDYSSPEGWKAELT